MFERLEKLISEAKIEGGKGITFELTYLNEEHQAAQEILTNFIDEGLPKLQSKHMSDISDNFGSHLSGIERLINALKEVFHKDLIVLNTSVHNV